VVDGLVREIDATWQEEQLLRQT